MVVGGWTGTIQEGTEGTTAGHRHRHDVGSGHTQTHGHHRVLHHDAGHQWLEVHLGDVEGALATVHIAVTVEAGVDRGVARQVAQGILADGELTNTGRAGLIYSRQPKGRRRMEGLKRSLDTTNGLLMSYVRRRLEDASESGSDIPSHYA